MVFVIHWHELAMDLHVFPIPIPPPTSLSTWSLWVFPSLGYSMFSIMSSADSESFASCFSVWILLFLFPFWLPRLGLPNLYWTIAVRESIPRQVDKKSEVPEEEKGVLGSQSRDRGLEFSRRRKGHLFFLLHSLVWWLHNKQLSLNSELRTDVEAETPILWPPDAKSWLIWKGPDAGKDWGQEEKGTTEDEMVGWHHRLNGDEFGQTPGVGDRQGGLACCGSWGHRLGQDWVT